MSEVNIKQSLMCLYSQEDNASLNPARATISRSIKMNTANILAVVLILLLFIIHKLVGQHPF